MLRSLFQSLAATLRGRNREGPPAATPADLRPADGDAEAASPRTLREEDGDRLWVAGASAEPPRPALDPQVVTEQLRHEVRERCQALLDGLPVPLRRTDAPRLLRSLLEEGETAIRQPPIAAQRALLVCRNSNSSVGELVALFDHDPGLAQALLKHANSSFYARGDDPCVALAAAVQRVGMQGVESVLLANMVQGMLCRPGGSYDALVQQVWNHMVRCAPIGRRIAPAFNMDSERAFALSLLHDSGKLVLFERISRLRQAWRRPVDAPQHFLLWALKRLHEPMGGLAVVQWGLGAEAARTVAQHHRDPVPQEPDPESEVVFLAERVDIAKLHSETPDWEALWAQGGLSGSPAVLEPYLAWLDQAA